MHRITVPSFDMLVSLHQQDAEAFEAFRTHLLQEAIDSAPPSRRPGLRQLLRRIDTARAEAATPMEAAEVAFDMMVESVQELSNSWQQAGSELAALQTQLALEQARR